MDDNPLRHLPSLDRLLNHLSASLLVRDYGRPITVEALRAVLNAARQRITANGGSENGGTVPSDSALIEAARETISAWLSPTLRPVINATGVIIHTNLGRAPLSDAAIDAVRQAAGGYSTLEYDLDSGKRGSRSIHAEALLQRITGAEAALVVNNNAAAVLLALTALAGPSPEHSQGRGVIVSRGQLVEIGGGFRMPDVMAQSGARLVEVGTTNRTHLSDYERAIAPDTALILRVHRSNFAIIGFTTEPTITELVQVAHQHNLLVVDDIGSGALFNTAEFGLAPEPLIQESLGAGVDLIMFSGDKLLGGPQAGILVGKAAVVDRLKRHPLTRALRPDKLCLAALSATLTHYLKNEALKRIPIWRMISLPLAEIEARARRWADHLTASGLICEVVEGRSAVGGGSLPGETLPTWVVSISLPSADAAAARLRACDPPMIARIEEDRLILDPRTVLDRDEDTLLGLLAGSLNPSTSS